MVLRSVYILLFLNIKCQQLPFMKLSAFFKFFLMLNRKASVQTQAVHRRFQIKME